MNNPSLRSITPAIDIYIKLAQYPILADTIRLRMREELHRRGIINQADFEHQVKKLAIESQRREGLESPYTQEEESVWELRKNRIRDTHTDAYFADNLGIALLEQLISEVLSDHPENQKILDLNFNPELAPWEMLFRQGEIYESMPKPERKGVEHHLQEIKVVLIKRMISDQLPFIAVAKHVLSISDLRRIYRRRIGGGKIGGKAAGMVLAWKILQQGDPEFGPDLSQKISIPESYFIGSEVIYEFSVLNQFDHFMNQKYRSVKEIRKEYPNIETAYLNSRFPDAVIERLTEVLARFGTDPLIVRSSSLLEDNFGFSFAGKYGSVFCPNQGSSEENLADLLNAVRRVFASLLNPDALVYRKHNNLLDYDERMSILIQRVQGERYGRYYFPTAAGVAYSHNPFRWSPKIRREDGFLRMVWGLGTRAVNRVANDYPRLVALSHPYLRPDNNPRAIRMYSQEMVDVIDLEANQFVTMHCQDLLKPDYPALTTIASLDRNDYLETIVAAGAVTAADKLVLTFEKLTKDQRFVKLMRTALMRLEAEYGRPVDVEFAIEILPSYPQDYKLHILQCRPLSQRTNNFNVKIPADIPTEDILFSSQWLVPDGKAKKIRYAVFVDPVLYRQISDSQIRPEIGRAIGRLNQILEAERFVLLGPGRWGSANLDLGVHVTYGDVYNCKGLIELGVAQDGRRPELSYGTHFFHDLIESEIFALGLYLDDKLSTLNWEFFRESPNCLAALSPDDANLAPYLRVIDITAVTNNRHLDILMDGKNDRAVGFLHDA
ncbi:MAG: PEP/pyruvate-binding domain-containing protein [Anaerolineales bacterium]|nr:PEP/pyruvate-binding domain-containing protein [Anaerolineales bacterium]